MCCGSNNAVRCPAYILLASNHVTNCLAYTHLDRNYVNGFRAAWVVVPLANHVPMTVIMHDLFAEAVRI